MITNKHDAYKEAEKIDNQISAQVGPLLKGNKYDIYNAMLFLRTIQTTMDILAATINGRMECLKGEKLQEKDKP